VRLQHSLTDLFKQCPKIGVAKNICCPKGSEPIAGGRKTTGAIGNIIPHPEGAQDELSTPSGCAAVEALLAGGLRPPATNLQPYGLQYSSYEADPDQLM